MVLIVMHYSSGTFDLNVLLNGCKCVIMGVKTNEFVCCVRLALFAEEELQPDFMYSWCHDCVPEFLFTLIKYTH